MSVWPGFGGNYKALQAFWGTDRAYFKLITATGSQFTLRPNLSALPIPWSAGIAMSTGSQANVYAYWRACAQYFASDPDFWVASGPAGPQGLSSNQGLTQSLWNSYVTAVLSECQYLVNNGITFSTFTLGNELSFKRYTNMTSLSQSAGTATAVTQVPHNLANGQTLNILGTNPAGYSGSFVITVVDSRTFTFSVDSSLASPANQVATSGATPIFGYCYDMTLSQYISNLNSLASQIKAISGWTMPISVDEWNYQDRATGTFTYSAFISNGLQNLDLMSIHPYGNITLSTNGFVIGGYAYIAEMMSAFGTKGCYLSELHVDASANNLNGYSPFEQAAQMANLLSTYILPYNGIKFAVYSYAGYENSDNQFAMLNTDGTFNPIWWQFFQSNPVYPGGVRH